MKSYLAFIALMFFAFSSKAQLAIINDAGGYVNVRKEKASGAEIVGKLYNNQVFLFYPDKDEWIEVSFNSNSFQDYRTGSAGLKKFPHYLNGFINRGQLMPIESLPHKKLNRQIRKLTANKAVIKVDSIVLEIKTRVFNSKLHKIHRSKGDCTNCAITVDKIDGKTPAGVDGEMPTVEISGIKLTINNAIVNIPAACFADIYQPQIKNLNIYADKSGNLYLYMPGNSDGAGAYDIVWVISNGKLVYRYVDVLS
jgi:hypothetical protein